MTAPTPPTVSALERELTEMHPTGGPPDRLASVIDGRVDAALKRHRRRPTRSPRPMLLLAATLSLVAALAIAGGAVAQRLASGCGITIEDGISFSDCVVGHPGLTNIGEPFWNTDIFERTPAEAAEMAAEKGYTIRWQIEDRGGTEAFDDDETRFTEEAPDCGVVEAGSVIEAGRIQMVVMMDDPLTPGSEC